MKKEKRDIFKEVIESARSVKLTERERASLFSVVDSYVKKNPALEPAVAPVLGEKKSAVAPIHAAKSEFLRNDLRWFSFMSASVTRMTSFAVIFFLILGGGTSFAAGAALPPDFLSSF